MRLTSLSKMSERLKTQRKPNNPSADKPYSKDTCSTSYCQWFVEAEELAHAQLESNTKMSSAFLGSCFSGISRRYPASRLRRLRADEWRRNLVRETTITPNDLIWPVFVTEGEGKTESIPAMPNVNRYSIDRLKPEVEKAHELGINAIALFPVVENKSATGEEALSNSNLICRTARELKREFPNVGLIGDVALDPYTTHGHDGVIDEEGYVLNDKTVKILVDQALNQADAGFDVIAPSDMQDGRIGAIRSALEKHEYHNTLILSYAAKYASAFYGPFRSAVGSASNLGLKDKRTYQQDPANGNEAIQEALMDIQEGADILMVKPGLPYLDVIYRIKQATEVPVFAYQVSGEYSMIQHAVEQKLLDKKQAILELLTCFKRAGCDAILSYDAISMAEALKT
eukprot:gb/GECG01016107.1/.p1 GENE.gb/GECG01016107.1/~~gb/GECG01016107.1/.p1  ORF type:complete len:399 (+),score=50.28 gb/GECG01016107.1/:1-1197(+)